MKNKYDYTKKYEKKQKDNIKEDVMEIEEENIEQEDPIVKTTGKVKVSKLNIRKYTDTDSDPLTTVNEGETLLIEHIDDQDWYGVCTASGIEGFALKEFIELD